MTDDPDDSDGKTGDRPDDDPTLDGAAGHALPASDLQYPTLAFDDGRLDDDGGFDLSKTADREEMSEVASDLAGALASHDLGIETQEGFTTLGVAPEGVDVRFDPDEDHRGELAVTFRLSAKSMVVADDDERVGSRGDTGFVPLSMLTDDRDEYRCYSWVEDPSDPD